jgi:hypothetical protein
MGTPGGYSGSSWITQPRVTRAHAQLVVDSARHKKKKMKVSSSGLWMLVGSGTRLVMLV